MKTVELKVVEKEEAKNVAQEVDALVAKAAAAGEKLRGFTQEQLDAIVKTMALAGVEHHVELAKLAWEETGKVYEDKITKTSLPPSTSTTALEIPRPLVSWRRTTKRGI